MVKEANASLISAKKKIDTVNKTEKSQIPPKNLIPPKMIKMTQLIEQINQGLF